MRYFKIYKYIFTIDLVENSINNENRNNIINQEYASYTTNEFKILSIENMVTGELINNIYSYKIGDIIKQTIIYFLSKERAFFELDYKYFEGSYTLIDKLYYIDFFKQHNLIYCGVHKSWKDSGELIEEFFHNNGEILFFS